MKQVAICPRCARSLPRGWLFTSDMNLTCPGCAASIRRKQGRDYLSSAILICAFPTSISLGALIGHALAGWWASMVGAVIGLVLVIPAWLSMMYAVFPYVSPYEEVARRCTQCNYNLTGNTSGVCPECGTATASTAGYPPPTHQQ